MDKTSIMNFLNCSQHFNNQLNSNSQIVVCFKNFTDFGKIATK